MKNRLRVLRAERNWFQADVAQELEVSRQSINAIETGKYDPSLPLAFKLARLSTPRSKPFSMTRHDLCSVEPGAQTVASDYKGAYRSLRVFVSSA